MRIAVIGLGLIGGSFAYAIKKHTDCEVLGFNRTARVVQEALAAGAVDAPLTDETLPTCGLVILALTPKAVIDWVAEHADRIAPGAVVFDICGVKRRVVEAVAPVAAAKGFVFVGGHPMAGKEVAGFANASASLFEKASMILTPEAATPKDVLAKLEAFFLEIGFGRVTISTPERHDRVIAYTSQLAHVASSAFVQNPLSRDHEGFSAGSFRDLTRVARLNEHMWTELFAANRDFLLEDLKLLIAELQAYREALETGDDTRMLELLRQGRLAKEASGT